MEENLRRRVENLEKDLERVEKKLDETLDYLRQSPWSPVVLGPDKICDPVIINQDILKFIENLKDDKDE